jgi:hypothetical protein
MEKEEVKEEKEEKKGIEFKGGVEKANLKGINNAIDAIAKIGMFLFSVFLISCLVLSTLSIITVAKKSKEVAASKDYVVEYLATVNNSSDTFIKERLMEDSKGEFIAFEIVVPTLIIISLLVMLIVLCKRVLSFIKDIKSDKKLFTREKLKESVNIINALLIIGMVYILFLASLFTVVLFIILDITLTIIYYLFKNCVEYEEKLSTSKEQ